MMTLAANRATTSAQHNNVISMLHAAGMIPNGHLLGTIAHKIDDAMHGTGAQQTAARTWLLAVLPPLRDFLVQMTNDSPYTGPAATDLTALIANL